MPDALLGGMKGRTTNPTKHTDCFTSDTTLSPASSPPVFPFDETVVTTDSVSSTIMSTSSVIVAGCERSISIRSVIKPVNDSIVSAAETINRATPAIIFVLQRTIPRPNTVVDATPTIIGRSQITVCGAQTIIFVTETVISSAHQDSANQGVPDGSREISISARETIISVLQITISKTIAIISAFSTSFLAAEIVVSAAEKTADAVPAGFAPEGRAARSELLTIANAATGYELGLRNV